MNEFANLTPEELVELVKQEKARADKATSNYENQKIRAKKAESKLVETPPTPPVDMESIIAEALGNAIKQTGITEVVEDVRRQKEAAEVANKRAEYVALGIDKDVVNSLINKGEDTIPQIVVEKFATKTLGEPVLTPENEEEKGAESLLSLVQQEV